MGKGSVWCVSEGEEGKGGEGRGLDRVVVEGVKDEW